VVNGVAYTSCTDVPEDLQRASPDAVLNWALSIITGITRTYSQLITPSDRAILLRGQYASGLAGEVSFRLPVVVGRASPLATP